MVTFEFEFALVELVFAVVFDVAAGLGAAPELALVADPAPAAICVA